MDNTKTVAQMAREIEAKVKEIFDNLDFSLDDNFMKAYKLFNYVVKNAKYDTSIGEEKGQDIQNYTYDECVVRDIYRCLCEKRTLCTSEANALAYMYDKLGIPVMTMRLKNQTKGYIHEVICFVLDDRMYYGDSTMVRTMINRGDIAFVEPYVFNIDQDTYFKVFRPDYKILSTRKPTDVSKFVNQDKTY